MRSIDFSNVMQLLHMPKISQFKSKIYFIS